MLSRLVLWDRPFYSKCSQSRKTQQKRYPWQTLQRIMKQEAHRNWRIIHCLALEFLTRRREKVNRMWCETLSCHISERDFLVRKKCNMQRAAHAGTFSISTKHQPDCTHTAHAHWSFVWQGLNAEKLSNKLPDIWKCQTKGQSPQTLLTQRCQVKEGYLQ